MASFAEWPCSVARVMDVFGDAWTPLIMRDAYQGIRRFDDFCKSLGIALNTLADRLRLLVERGLLTKRLYQDNPPRNEYLLTEMGADFFPALTAMLAWGDRWLDDGAGPPVTVQHLSCGHDAAAAVVCGHCQQPLALPDAEFRLGPGYPDELPAHLDNRARYAPATTASPRQAPSPQRPSGLPATNSGQSRQQ
jgi:DNA-binding HxlR family transcriptional regulator